MDLACLTQIEICEMCGRIKQDERSVKIINYTCYGHFYGRFKEDLVSIHQI